ncbi:MAG: hypothetical protein HC822_06375 [Oscillochloris sp.]|nr:hypothetical protein [Oscillochloris sp.]
MRYGIMLILVTLLLSSCATVGQANDVADPTRVLEACRLRAPAAVEQIAAECGTLAVPADYAQPNGATIDLNLAVIPAIGRSATTDPLVLLAGGPGQGAITSFVPLVSRLGSINQNRDILLVDQRGTGDSTPLNCPIDSLPTEDSPAAYTAWVQDCVERQSVDPRLFTTMAAARDLEAVRVALGYSH